MKDCKFASVTALNACFNYMEAKVITVGFCLMVADYHLQYFSSSLSSVFCFT